MRRQSISMSKLNLRNLQLAYTITAVGFLLMTIVSMVQVIQGAGEYFERSYLLSSGNMLYLLILCGPIVIPAVNFVRAMHIGGRKADFLNGAFMTYAVFAAVVSIANLVFYVSVDRIWANIFQVANLAAVFGWTENGMVIAFFQQFVFLLLVSAVVHTLVAIQGSKFGRTIDILLIMAFTSFIAVPFLRSVLITFLRLITVWQNAWIQILTCLLVTVVLYIVNKPILNKKVLE